MSLDHGGRLDQYHQVEAARPHPVEQDPQKSVHRAEPHRVVKAVEVEHRGVIACWPGERPKIADEDLRLAGVGVK